MNMRKPEKTNEWNNYGDMNPEDHGGRFIKWTGGSWELIETSRSEDIAGEDFAEENGEHMIEHIYIYPDEVFIDGNPENGFTDTMHSIFDSLGMDRNLTPENPEIMDNLQYYLADFNYYIGGNHYDFKDGDYWDIVESYGVNPEDIV